MLMKRLLFCLTLLSLVPVSSNAQAPQKPAQPATKPAQPPAKAAQLTPDAQTLQEGVILQKWTGDLDGMIKRRRIRVLTPYSRTHYFIDKGQQRGVAYDAFSAFEEVLNKKYKTGNLRVHVVFVPTSRDELAAALLDGRGDVAFASIVVTPEREKIVDFTIPTNSGVSEVVVTGPKSPKIATLDDLAGQEVFVRQKSIYHEGLVRLNEDFKKRGKPAVVFKFAPDNLEDEDLLEMLNAGLVKVVVVYSHIAQIWQQVFPNIVVNDKAVVVKDLNIATAIRKNSPKLKAELDAFIKTHGRGTTFGNILFAKYMKSTQYLKSATNDADIKRFRSIVELFRKYSEKYDVDFLLMAAQGYQESRLDQNVKSQVGAVGVMQIMPATGKELKVGDITKLEPNIHAGVKYMRFMIDQYFAKEPMTDLDKGLFTFASYNAGPGRVRQLRREAEKRGLNPNVWFNNVERIASERIGRETVTYVSNIYKYYIAYKLVQEEMAEKAKTKGST
jgi:membrane-bound lytic murein transglycosylase MltF